MTDDEIDTLVLTLQTNTALGRLGHSEALSVFSELAALGYSITKPAALVPAPAKAAAS